MIEFLTQLEAQPYWFRFIFFLSVFGGICSTMAICYYRGKIDATKEITEILNKHRGKS